MNTDRIKKIVSWVGINACFGWLVYFGYFVGNATAATIFVTLTCLTNFLFLFAAVALIACYKRADFRARITATTNGQFTSVPRWIDIMYDIGMIVALTFTHAWFALGAYSLHMVLQTFVIEFARNKLVTNAVFADMDSEDEDRDELIRLGVLDRRQ